MHVNPTFRGPTSRVQEQSICAVVHRLTLGRSTTSQTTPSPSPGSLQQPEQRPYGSATPWSDSSPSDSSPGPPTAASAATTADATPPPATSAPTAGSARATRYRIERELWAWWQAKREWMRAPRRTSPAQRPALASSRSCPPTAPASTVHTHDDLTDVLAKKQPAVNYSPGSSSGLSSTMKRTQGHQRGGLPHCAAPRLPGSSASA